METIKIYLFWYFVICLFFWLIIRNDNDIKEQSLEIKLRMFLKMPIYFVKDVLKTLFTKK